MDSEQGAGTPGAPSNGADVSGGQFMQIRAVVEDHERRIRTHYGSFALSERVDRLLGHYHDTATNSIAAAKAFAEDVSVALRALALVADSVASAGTHREKDARLRGLIEILEGALTRVRNHQWDVQNTSIYSFLPQDVFRSDYPQRRALDRIRELESQLAEVKGDDASAGNAVTGEETPF